MVKRSRVPPARGEPTTSGAAKGVVDKAVKAKWEKAIDQYRVAREADTSGWDERYEALGDIVEANPPLYLAGGYATMRRRSSRHS